MQNSGQEQTEKKVALVEQLIEALSKPPGDTEESNTTFDEILLLDGDEQLLSILRDKYLQSDSEDEKSAAIQLLSLDNSQANIDFFIEQAKSDDELLRKQAYEALAMMDRPRASEELVQFLLDASYYENEHENLANLTLRMGDLTLSPEHRNLVKERLTELVDSSQLSTQSAAVTGLIGLSEAGTSRETFNRYIKSNNEALQMAALEGIFRREDITFDEPLIKTLTDIANNRKASITMRAAAMDLLNFNNPAFQVISFPSAIRQAGLTEGEQ